MCFDFFYYTLQLQSAAVNNFFLLWPWSIIVTVESITVSVEMVRLAKDRGTLKWLHCPFELLHPF